MAISRRIPLRVRIEMLRSTIQRAPSSRRKRIRIRDLTIRDNPASLTPHLLPARVTTAVTVIMGTATAMALAPVDTIMAAATARIVDRIPGLKKPALLPS